MFNTWSGYQFNIFSNVQEKREKISAEVCLNVVAQKAGDSLLKNPDLYRMTALIVPPVNNSPIDSAIRYLFTKTLKHLETFFRMLLFTSQTEAGKKINALAS